MLVTVVDLELDLGGLEPLLNPRLESNFCT